MTDTTIRPIDPASRDEIETVAVNMRRTLCEVLGEEQGEAMYSMEWLIERVRFHLDPNLCIGEVFVAEQDGEIIGHAIVRLEEEEEHKRFGLFSTVYVKAEARRQGVATALLEKGGEWLSSYGMEEFRTYTDERNKPLVELFEKHGYEAYDYKNEFVLLRRSLNASG